jgi:hypothetical protein
MSTDHPGFNADYPEGDDATRARIWQDHVDYVQGLFWFLAHDPSIPEDLRKQVNEWGLAADEFTDNHHWPYALYIREARRLVGGYVMRQQDCQTQLTKPDAIAMGSFILDSHCVQRIVGADGYVIDEGNFDVPARPYQIPYRSIVPRDGECENLLVPVCMSASHVAYGSIRMEPVFMSLGHAAGLAAVQAMRTSRSVQAIDVGALQKQLREQKQVLELAPGKGAGRIIELTGIFADDQDAKFVGEETLDGPRHIVFHPSGKFVYVENEKSSSVTAFRFDASTGTLAVLQKISQLPAGADAKALHNSGADLHLTPDGRFLYSSNRGHHSIAGFAVDQSTGKLTFLGATPCPSTPRAFAIDPTGNFLLAAGQGSTQMEAYRINPQTGELKSLAVLEVGKAPAWIEIVND